MKLTPKGELRARLASLAMVLDLDGPDVLIDREARHVVDAIEAWARSADPVEATPPKTSSQ